MPEISDLKCESCAQSILKRSSEPRSDGPDDWYLLRQTAQTADLTALARNEPFSLSFHVTKRPKTDTPDAPSFEDALAEVEAIIERIESGEVGLEQTLAQYERGVTLISQCRQTLSRVAAGVEDLTKRLDSADGEAKSRGNSGHTGVGSEPAADDQ